MKEFALNGQKRETVGKKASRLLRKEGLVPCNIYGEHTEDGKPKAMSFAIAMADLRKVIYTPHIYV
jgi:large subunit ribosomal protein L25